MLAKKENNNDSNNEGNSSLQVDDYDPYSNRIDGHFVSNFGSWTHLVKSVAGTGIFAMSNAFACVGLLIGIIGTILLGFLITMSSQFLVKTHYRMCVHQKKPTLSYDEVVVATLTTIGVKGQVAVYIVDIIMLVCYIGIGSVYVLFISGIIEECVDPNRLIGLSYYVIILLPFFFIMNMVKNLKALAPISTMGNLFLLAAVIIGIVYAIKDGISNTWVMVNPEVKLYPKFLGTVFFSMTSPGLILEIEHSMKKPWDYDKKCGVLNWGMAFLVIAHAFVGSIAYLKWGDESLGNFIRNHTENDAATITALIMQCLAIYFTYGLQCFMPIAILYNEYILPALEKGTCKGSPNFWNVVVRSSVTIFTCILALAIPKLDLFTGLVGGVCIATLGTLIPVTLYIIVNYGDYGLLRWKLLVASFMLIVGLIAMLCATVTSIALIWQYFRYGD